VRLFLVLFLPQLPVIPQFRDRLLAAGWPPATARPRSSSALNSAPSRIATFEIHIQIRKMTHFPA